MSRAGSERKDLIDADTRRWLRRRILAWYPHGGRDFPWRHTRNPYRVLIAELLLQRTRADLVEPLYHRFLHTYATPGALARAEPADVVELLQPLGYRHRSARLPALGQALIERHRGTVPRSKEDLLALPGVGDYVANAVLAVAFDERRPLLDPNVVRVLERALGRRSHRPRPRDDQTLWNELARLLPARHAREFALGLVDLGATVCRPRRPRCHQCPLNSRCRTYNTGQVRPATAAPPRP